MKKITYLLLAAMSLVSVASCVKELTPEPMQALGNTHEFTVALPPATRTALVEGKTVWAKGDSLWVSNGTASEAVVVPEEAWGQKEFTFVAKEVYITEDNPKLYVVYPYTAAATLSDGKVRVKVPGVQNGEFASANIAAAVSEGYAIALKNVTSVLKVTVPEETEAPIYSLNISAANGNVLTGTCTVDFSGDTPVLTPASTGSSVAVQVDGLNGDFYVAVIPGTYDAGFKLLAATVDFQHASQIKESTVANTLQVNDLVDLGTIGDNLQPLSGDGTEASPWLLESLGHMIAFTSAVNDGNSFEGEHVKLAADIEGVTTPIGSLSVSYSNSAYNVTGNPFKGHFDGSGHTIAMDISASTVPARNNNGLFGGLGDGAVVENLTIEGSINTGGGNFIGALAGMVYSDLNGVTIRNVTNKAKVSGNNHVGGLIGEADQNVANLLVIDHCVNEGDVIASSFGIGGIVGWLANKNLLKTITSCTNKGRVQGIYQVGGIFGYGYFAKAQGCVNEGSVTGTQDCGGLYGIVGSALKFESNDYNRGVGGIGGWSQNGYYVECVNSGEITGITKVGGIGGANYWTHTTDCTNSGTITATGTRALGAFSNMSVNGGIVGWQMTQGNITGCENTGTVKGNAAVGGVVGRIDSGGTNGGYQINVKQCKNSGEVKGNGAAVGGIAGLASSMANNRYVIIDGNENSGAITNASQQTGGIVGDLYDLNNSAMGRVLNCVNTGNIQGTIWSGGVIGYAQSRATKGAFYVRNCENHGRVLGTRADADNGEVVGGIVGAVNNPSAGLGLQMFNCLNSGEVRYREASHVKPYAGGIIGNFQRGKIENVVNVGTVGLLEGTPAEGAENYLGAIAGNLSSNAADLGYAYYVTGAYTQVVGAAGYQPDPSEKGLSSFDTYGMLTEPAIVNGNEVYFVDEALNLWVTAHTDFAYYSWEWALDKPAFVKE